MQELQTGWLERYSAHMHSVVQELERMKGVKVGNILTCLICGQETEVEGVPLADIKEKSLHAQNLLCDKLDWCKGIQVMYSMV